MIYRYVYALKYGISVLFMFGTYGWGESTDDYAAAIKRLL